MAVSQTIFFTFFSLSLFAISERTSLRGFVRSGRISSSFMRCQPNLVLTGPLTSPFFMEKTFSSKGFTIMPLLKKPRSPPFFPEALSSEYFFASAEKDLPFSICLFMSRSSFFFASTTVSLASWGTLRRMCLARLFSGTWNSSLCSW